MTIYSPPLADIEFVLRHVIGAEELSGFEPYGHADVDTIVAVLGEYGRFVAEQIAPTNRQGDIDGAVHHADGTVTTPEGYPDLYQRHVEAGWNSVPFPPAWGGGGFPWLVGVAMQELLTSSNMAFSLCPLLTQGAIDALLHHGDETLQQTYLAKMITGEWTGTMNLTEPHAGSDVGALSSKAVPADDGTYRITGTKIYITYGEHDLTDQIVHLVLARTPDGPPGTKGISCFVVPKYVLEADGSLGAKNDVTCVSIEHKLGIHASPTCVLSFGDAGEGAVGYLIGQENEGMRVMFTMMNNARLSVGLEGLAIGERSFQAACDYSQERTQGRAIGAPAGASSPIADHPDVRRMLMHMKSHIEALRCLIYLNASAIDRANHHPDEGERIAAKELADLLTPLSKGWGTDCGVDIASVGVQVHGGMGFVEETGVAQHYRDIRIGPIYEGTNGIQAADLVGRKLPMRRGGVVQDLLGDMNKTVESLSEAGPELAPIKTALADAVAALGEASAWIAERGAGSPAEALAASSPYLKQFGTVVGGWLLARSALAAAEQRSAGEGDDDFLAAKIVTARFYAQNVLPTVRGLLGAVTAGSSDLFAIPTEQLSV